MTLRFFIDFFASYISTTFISCMKFFVVTEGSPEKVKYRT